MGNTPLRFGLLLVQWKLFFRMARHWAKVLQIHKVFYCANSISDLATSDSGTTFSAAPMFIASFGMPKEAINIGAAEKVVPLSDVAKSLILFAQ